VANLTHSSTGGDCWALAFPLFQKSIMARIGGLDIGKRSFALVWQVILAYKSELCVCTAVIN